MEVYRITLKQWSKSLKASGAAARWNSRGIEMIYCASSRSLACLENIVHLNSIDSSALYATMVIYVPDDSTLIQISMSDLPADWYKSGDRYYKLTRPFGDGWISGNKDLICKVPSAIIANEFNFLINPNHPEFNRVKLIETESFFFDNRIKP